MFEFLLQIASLFLQWASAGAMLKVLLAISSILIMLSLIALVTGRQLLMRFYPVV